MSKRRVAYVDASAGIAGDMLMGALLDAGGDLDAAQRAVESVGISGLTVGSCRTRRGGLECLQAKVVAPDENNEHRHLDDVVRLINRSTLRGSARAYAQRVFELLANAEGAAHGVPPEQVHFHEVGAFDAIGDVLGTATLLDHLGLLTPDAEVVCSVLAAGSGTVGAAHGRMSVPVPAVLNLISASNLQLGSTGVDGERTTPTGAALLCALAHPGPFPTMHVEAVGMGAGSRDTSDRPNVTRVALGTFAESDTPVGSDTVEVVECTVDDLDPQAWPSVLDAVREAGALDCWASPILARHGRPGYVLSAVCVPSTRPAVVATLFTHTGTFGARWSTWERATLHRANFTIPIGDQGEYVISVKVGSDERGIVTVKPEHSDVDRVAAASGRSVRAVRDEVIRRYHATTET